MENKAWLEQMQKMRKANVKRRELTPFFTEYILPYEGATDVSESALPAFECCASSWDKSYAINMSDIDFNNICKKHGTVYTDSELISNAFSMTSRFATWDLWLDHKRAIEGEAVVDKLGRASEMILRRLPQDASHFGVGAITPERVATETLESATMVPRDFVEYLGAKGVNSRHSA